MSDCCQNAGADEPTYRCEKHRIEMCDTCLRCKDPDLYCKFRSACMIFFLEKERAGSNCDQPSPRECSATDGSA